MSIVEIVLYSCSALLLTAFALPLVHSDYWVFRVFEYPRFQKLILCVLLLIGWAFVGPWQETPALVVMGLLVIALIYLCVKIFPYTFLSPKEMKHQRSLSGTNIRLFSGNVLQYNQCFDAYRALIKKADPDIVFLLETGHEWERAMRPLEADYPYSEKMPLDNTYGMLFYSRLPIRESRVHFLVEEDVPSMYALVELDNGQLVRIWGLHPKPPMPNENLRSTAKDKELMKVALQIRESDKPVIVVGDLNDVAWSHTTELFRKTSELLDPRRGRGFYSTFHAKHWFMRFPLDYIFASSHFTLSSMQRLPATGSDHFPILTELHYNESDGRTQKEPHADREELQEAKEKAGSPAS